MSDVISTIDRESGTLDTDLLPPVLFQAIMGELGIDAALIAQEGLRIVELVVRKNHDYGSSVFRPPTLAPDLTARQAIMVRLSDKIARAVQLSGKGGSKVEENLDDTFRDIAGYALLWILARRP